MSINIYADGACRGNGSENNIGAWAYKITLGDRVKVDVSTEINTTNNKMELLSVINALKSLKNGALLYDINVYSDSQYVVKGINEWSSGWISRNFSGVKNVELWKELLQLKDKFKYIKFIWVKGHDKTEGNLFVDRLCNDAMDGKL